MYVCWDVVVIPKKARAVELIVTLDFLLIVEKKKKKKKTHAEKRPAELNELGGYQVLWLVATDSLMES